MQPVTELPLRGYRVFEGRATDELHSFLARKRLDLRLDGLDRAQPIEAQVNAAYLPGMYLSALTYGAAVEIAAPPDRADYAVQIPLTGALEAETARTSLTIGRGQAVIGSPGRDQTIRSTAGCVRMVVSLQRDAVVRQLSALLNDAVIEPLVFDPRLALDNPHAASLAGLLRWATAELERSPSLLANPLAATQMEQLLITALLIAQPNTYRDRLDRPAPGGVSTRGVRRAADFIDANAGDPLTLADLVAASGVAGRTLHKHFRRFMGVSPMAYLRNVRLQKAREELLREGEGGSVTEIAARWGFEHLGRFAIEYRRRYGERPSETLRRRR